MIKLLVDTEKFNLWFNITVIVTVIIGMALLWLALNFMFDKWFVTLSESIGKLIGSKIKNKWLVTLIEVITLLLPLIFLIAQIVIYIITSYGENDFMIYWFVSIVVFFLGIFISISTVAEFERLHPKYNSSVSTWLNNQIMMLKLNRLRNIYFINRAELLMEQMPDFLKAILILQVSLFLLINLNWTDDYYFLTVCFIPFYANYWVYYIKVLTVNPKQEDVFIRRVVMYILMMAVATYELFSRFQSYINEVEVANDIQVFLLAGSAVLYIALDRILKEVTVDYVKFKENPIKNSKEKGNVG